MWISGVVSLPEGAGGLSWVAWCKGEVDDVYREAEVGLERVNGVLVSVKSESEVLCG